jgi:hypothetical protein
MCNIDENANLVLSFGILLCDTCCFSQSIPTIFFSLLIFVMPLTCLWLKLFNMQQDKLSLWPCFKSKNLIGILHELRDGAALRAMGSADPYEKLKILH